MQIIVQRPVTVKICVLKSRVDLNNLRFVVNLHGPAFDLDGFAFVGKNKQNAEFGVTTFVLRL